MTISAEARTAGGPRMMVSRSVPIAWMRSTTSCFAPLPIAISAITEATPMMIPSIVRTVRMRLWRSERIAIFRDSPRTAAPGPARPFRPDGSGEAASPLGLRLVGCDPPVGDANQPVCVRGDVGVVGDDDYRVAMPVQFFQNGHDLLAALVVERPGRFVGQYDRPAVHERAGDADALLLSAGELAGVVLQTVAQPQSPQQLRGMRVSLRLRHAAVDCRNFRVLDGAQIGHQVVALEYEAERIAPQRRQSIAVQTGHVHAADAIGSGGRPVEAADDVHEGGLARAGGAHDCDEFPALDRQGHVLQDRQRLAARDTCGRPWSLEQGRRHHGPFRVLSALVWCPPAEISPDDDPFVFLRPPLSPPRSRS